MGPAATRKTRRQRASDTRKRRRARVTPRPRKRAAPAPTAAQLAAINRELEAFSYSVSHDLRAPLRAIIGFSEALRDDYADRLDAEGRELVDRVVAAGQRMTRLLDALLSLSRLSRSDMQHEMVDLSALAQAVVEELRSQEPHRAVTFDIQDGIVAAGDARLLRLVIENLLGNAWKFTAQHAHASIEFKAATRKGERVFYVRDDGAGFNMQMVDRLFGAFQRLHPAADFDGTGIGLATVQRIVHRHGGRVWAEGEVEKGATFSFTLGGDTPSLR